MNEGQDGVPPDEGGATDEVRRLAVRLEGLLRAVPDAEMRARLAASELPRLPAATCAAVLAVLVRRAAAREGAAGDAVSAVSRALSLELVSYEWKASLYAAAVDLDARDVAGLFLALPAQRRFEQRDEFHDPALSDLTLGHRKSLARRATADTLLKLALIGEPAVVKALLDNPRVTEAMAVRIASRRPMRPETLASLARSRRFGASRAVRRALCQNPYTPGEVALRLVPLLLAQDWRSLLSDSTVHPHVRAEARRLLAARGGKELAHVDARLDPDEERRLLAESRRRKAAEKADREAAERRRESDDARAAALAMLEELAGGLTLGMAVDDDDE